MDNPVVEHTRRNQYHIPRNVWVVSITSFLTDISSEMVINLLPLYLSNVLGVRTNIIGLIEGVAESTSSILKIISGWMSDRLSARKWLAVAGYALSTLAKPFFYFANSWGVIAGARWADRLGKGVRTAPRDALVADSTAVNQRGWAFGFHRAADTAGAVLGISIAMSIVWITQRGIVQLGRLTFQIAVLSSLLPAALAVIVLAVGAKDVKGVLISKSARVRYRTLGKPFVYLLVIVGVFELGNSSDAFIILRSQERGMNVMHILGMLIAFNLIYSVVSAPAGLISDRIGRKKVIIIGWFVYAGIYLGFALAKVVWHIWILYAIYGVYYGLTYGTAKALVADITPQELRGTAYGTYNAVLGLSDLPASLIAGILWQGVGSWQGFGPSAPFLFGAGMSFLAAIGLVFWRTSQPIQS
jgi:MFS family permease